MITNTKEFPMNTEMLMLYKLMILYILDRIDFSMTSAQLTEFFIGHNYTDYITLQETISDLVADGFIEQENKRNRTLYRITQSGGEALSFFFKDISLSVRQDIDHYLYDQRYQLKDEQSTPADYYELKHNEFLAECKILDRDSTILNLQLSVPSEADAEKVCNNWRENSSEIYSYIVTKLLVGKEKE